MGATAQLKDENSYLARENDSLADRLSRAEEKKMGEESEELREA